jgi:predicted ATPase
MDSIRIKNLRSIIDTGDIPIKPLTVLVGANSTGKSTFLRTFPLLRQSVETATNNPILWYGRYVDFGSIEEAIRTATSAVVLEFNFNLAATDDSPIPVVADTQLRLGMELKSRENNELDNQLAKLTVNIGIDQAILEFDKFGKVTHFEVNARPLTKLFKSLQISQSANFVPSISEIDSSVKTGSSSRKVYQRQKLPVKMLVLSAIHRPDSFSRYVEKLSKHLETLCHDDFLKDSVDNRNRKMLEVAIQMGVGSTKETFLSNFRNKKGKKFWNSNVSRLKSDSDNLQLLRDIFFACQIPIWLVDADQRLAEFASGVQYIGPFRAIAERYYRLQNLAVEEIDHRGENLPMYLNSLSESQRNNFAEWSNQYFGIKVDIEKQGGQLVILVKEENHSQPKNLVDVGFGYSQLLPVMVQLWSLRSQNLRRSPWTKPIPSLIAIEQPELHLHPRLQAQLADVFAYLVKQSDKRKLSAFRLLIETHSETIINRLGQLIQRGDLSPANVQIVLFEPDKDQGGTKVRTTTYDDEGCLIDWPYGFFLPDLT